MKCIMLAGEGTSTNIIYNFLSEKIKIDALILERPKDKKTFLKRRIKKLGFFNVFGQLLFRMTVVPILKRTSKERINQIYKENSLNCELDYNEVENCYSVENASCHECEQIIRKYNPDLIILNGTSIIKENILSCTNAKIVNNHAGITPKYRGVHGAYWALYNSDLENCGVTVHLVDKGIDTGGILYQRRIQPTEKDNFVTYPMLQLAAALDLLYKAIIEISGNRAQTFENGLPSKLYYHPTIWQYLYGRIFKKVK